MNILGALFLCLLSSCYLVSIETQEVLSGFQAKNVRLQALNELDSDPRSSASTAAAIARTLAHTSTSLRKDTTEIEAHNTTETEPTTTSPTVVPVLAPSPQPSTQRPTSTPSQRPHTLSPSLSPSVAPSLLLTVSPSSLPSLSPSAKSTSSLNSSSPTILSCIPSSSPSQSPSAVPTSSVPISSPSLAPSSSISAAPSSSPSSPSSHPSVPSSVFPSSRPSSAPSSVPSSAPTSLPSSAPSSLPTSFPSCIPSSAPSLVPSSCPSLAPSAAPSSLPSSSPSLTPSSRPSLSPTLSPTPQGRWWFLLSARVTLSPEASSSLARHHSSMEVREGLLYAFSFVLTDSLTDGERERVTVALNALFGHNSERSHANESLSFSLRAWSEEHSAAVRMLNTLARVRDNPMEVVGLVHERGLREVDSLRIDSLSLTRSSTPPETLSPDLSPEHIVYIIAGTVALFVLSLYSLRHCMSLWKERETHARSIRLCLSHSRSCVEATSESLRENVRELYLWCFPHSGGFVLVSRNADELDDDEDLQRSMHYRGSGRLRHYFDDDEGRGVELT